MATIPVYAPKPDPSTTDFDLGHHRPELVRPFPGTQADDLSSDLNGLNERRFASSSPRDDRIRRQVVGLVHSKGKRPRENGSRLGLCSVCRQGVPKTVGSSPSPRAGRNQSLSPLIAIRRSLTPTVQFVRLLGLTHWQMFNAASMPNPSNFCKPGNF
jgi:hypothetical protein